MPRTNNRVLKRLSELRTPQSINELSRYLLCSHTTIWRALIDLEHAGMVNRTTLRKKSFWSRNHDNA